MKIYTPDDCEKWVKYSKFYNFPTKIYLFSPVDENNNKLHIHRELVDLIGKCYNHNQQRIENNIEQLLINFPQLKPIIDQLTIYLCPRPSLHIENATTWSGKHIVYWARGTQIPFCMTDYITGHEIGHCVQDYFCPDRKENRLWREYLSLRNAPRGICKVYDHYDDENEITVYSDSEDFYCINGSHEQKPKHWHDDPVEWFAEDFRYLFGVDTGEPYWGFEIPLPDESIKNFFLKL